VFQSIRLELLSATALGEGQGGAVSQAVPVKTSALTAANISSSQTAHCAFGWLCSRDSISKAVNVSQLNEDYRSRL